MRLRLPTTRTFAYLFGGSVAGVIFMLVAGNAMETALGSLEARPWLRISYLAILFGLLLMAAYTGLALVVRSIIGFQAAFWTRVAKSIRSQKTADTVARTVPSARTIGDMIILAGWALWTAGLVIAVPAMLRDMPS